MLATLPDAVWAAPISFLFGVGVGFVLSNRYRIVKRDGSEK